MEEKLLKLLDKKPEKGLEKLMNTYSGLVYTIVHNKLYLNCSKEDIEECISAIFFEVYEKRHNIDLVKGSLKAFLAVTAKRRAIDLYRNREKNIGKVVSLENYIGEEIMHEKLSYISLESIEQETKKLLIKGIKSLGEPDSEIFIRKYYFGQPTKVIAKLLGIKDNTVDKKVSRGLIKLKGFLEDDISKQERKDI